MGLWDKLKDKANEVKDKANQAVQEATRPAQQHAAPISEDEDTTVDAAADDGGDDDGGGESEGYDLAGFDPNDEDAFFNAVNHMESEGLLGGTDESRAEICQRYGIRDRSHWQTVKDSVYQALAQKHGDFDVVAQRELNWKMGQTQRAQQAHVQTARSSGAMAPVEGVTLEAWAAFNATIVQGTSLDDLLKGAGIDRGRWDRVNAEWNARMSRDTTFAVATVYGAAFQSASTGKYNAYAKEANAARAENRELKMEPPVTLEQYYEIMFEQAYASKMGKDAAAALKSCGLSIVDWTDLGSFMGYHFTRTAMLRQKEYEATYKKVLAKFEAKYPGTKPDVDISF